MALIGPHMIVIEHRSTMLGYITVSFLMSALGLGGAIFPFCYCLGWDSEATMVS
jgi:hypothetical protein